MERYSIKECIGRGNYGSAFLAYSVDANKAVVIKQIPIETLSDQEKATANGEANVLSTLVHPSIVEYQESFVENDTLHIVMGYCSKGDLAQRIKERREHQQELGLFPEQQILDWFSQIVAGIKCIHDKRILHRDLKTNNIFLSENNDIKIGDFGIARVLESTLDQAKTVVGTPYYMSPEVCASKPYSYASDIWALGCILYELCTLKHPFQASNLLGLVFQIVQHKHSPLPENYSPSLRQLVDWLLEKDPEKRPTIQQVLDFPLVADSIKGSTRKITSTSTKDAPNKEPAKELNPKWVKIPMDNDSSGDISLLLPPPVPSDSLLDGLRLPERSSSPRKLVRRSSFSGRDFDDSSKKKLSEAPTTMKRERSKTELLSTHSEFADQNFNHLYNQERVDSRGMDFRSSRGPRLSLASELSAQSEIQSTDRSSVGSSHPGAVLEYSCSSEDEAGQDPKPDDVYSSTSQEGGEETYYSDEEYESDFENEGDEVLEYSTTSIDLDTRPSSMEAQVAQIKQMLCAKVGEEKFDQVYSLLRDLRVSGRRHARGELEALVGRSNLDFCFETDQLITLEDAMKGRVC